MNNLAKNGNENGGSCQTYVTRNHEFQEHQNEAIKKSYNKIYKQQNHIIDDPISNLAALMLVLFN
jgi:hypothetical protein